MIIEKEDLQVTTKHERSYFLVVDFLTGYK